MKKDIYHKFDNYQILKIGNWYSVHIYNKYGYLFNTAKKFKSLKKAREFIRLSKAKKYSNNLVRYYS